MIDAANLIASGKTLSSQSQTGESSYYSFPDEEQIKEFHESGLRLFDSQHAMELVKAYQMQYIG